MVDIIIGSVPSVGPSVNSPPSGTNLLEAEILDIRNPRRVIQGPDGEERRRTFRQDPVNGRVLTLLIPNGTSLPKDLAVGKYKVSLRFVKK